MIDYVENKYISIDDVMDLYTDAGWSAYTNDKVILQKAIENSDFVYTAWDKNVLVGLVRAISDNNTIVYIQDILVHKDYKRKGIGSKLMGRVLEKYSGIRQKVLLTDLDSTESNEFYKSIGFRSCENMKTVAYIYKESP